MAPYYSTFRTEVEVIRGPDNDSESRIDAALTGTPATDSPAGPTNLQAVSQGNFRLP